jgi:hypothetical protein
MAAGTHSFGRLIVAPHFLSMTTATSSIEKLRHQADCSGASFGVAVVTVKTVVAK